MATMRTIRGGDGLMLSVGEWGKADGRPILLIHGFSQSHLCWSAQMNSNLAGEFRLVALDLRGHGMSEKPLARENYNDGRLWAEDIAAVIDELALARPVLVGWSYGGFVMSDYVSYYGQDAIAGINFVGAAVKRSEANPMAGPGIRDNAEAMTADDLADNIAGVRRFLRACTAEPLDQDAFETALAYNMVVPARVRAGLIGRELDFDAVLEALELPVLVTHGKADQVVLPAMGEHILTKVAGAEASFYGGVGHSPFLEDPERFNRELADFTRRANAA